MKHPTLNITLLGTGTCVPSLKRSACALLIETGDDKIVADTGPGTMRRLLEAGNSIFDVSMILYSHLHPDHTAEFVPFLFATKYSGGHRDKPLKIIAAKGFHRFYNGLKNVYGKWIELEPGMLEIIELENASDDFYQTHHFTIRSTPVAHTEQSLAYRFETPNGTSAVYSGDTEYCESLIRLAYETDLLICESAFPDEAKIPKHLTPSLAGKVAAAARAKQLVLTHFYPECDQVDVKEQCRKTFKGNLIIGQDLMQIGV